MNGSLTLRRKDPSPVFSAPRQLFVLTRPNLRRDRFDGLRAFGFPKLPPIFARGLRGHPCASNEGRLPIDLL